MGMRPFNRVKLYGVNLTVKYLTINCTVVADVDSNGTIYPNCRLSRIAFNRLMKGECVEGKILKLAPYTDVGGVLHTDSYSFQIIPKR